MLAAQALSRARLLYQWAASAAFYNTTYCGSVVPCEGAALPLHGSWSAAQAAGGSQDAVLVPWAAYPSSTVLDDLAWAGAWLHRATGGQTMGVLCRSLYSQSFGLIAGVQQQQQQPLQLER
jgi:hypothetical protein